MFYRIMVPLDGSSRAEAAIPVAARLARASHGTVILMRSVELHLPIAPPAQEAAAAGAILSSYEREQAGAVADYLEKMAALKALEGLSVITRVTEGPAVDNILSLSEEERVDLIVMCARGVKGYHRWKLGGVTQHVTHHAQAPVLVLNEFAPGAPDIQFADACRALIPLDGSALAETAIPAAIRLLTAQAPETGTLHLLRVISPFASEDQGTPEAALVSEAGAYLKSIADRLTATPTEQLRLTFTTEVVVDTDAAGAILDIAEPAHQAEDGRAGQGCDIIVMATHGRTGVLRWSMGSITERVLQSTELPMLIVRPVPAPATEAEDTAF
ncbi:MAG TPA: universal stress protein [Ktedonobacterales bacterium]